MPVLLSEDASGRSKRGGPARVQTIHNLAYQGLFEAHLLERLGLPSGLFSPEALEYWGRWSFLKGGIVYSDVVTTVSPRYAEEIQTPALGCGFDGMLRGRRDRVVGILNGVDGTVWNPATDAHLPAPYSASHLNGKQSAKRALLAEFEWWTDPAAMARPLVGMVSRLVEQKGFELLTHIGAGLAELDATFVALGTGDERYERFWRELAAQYPQHIGARIGYDEGLAHQIVGGADALLMPSRFEPCGLNQMYSLRYGTVPVVHATGGLYDMVAGWDPVSGAGTGFVFAEFSPAAVMEALRRMLETYRTPEEWRRMQVRGMQ